MLPHFIGCSKRQTILVNVHRNEAVFNPRTNGATPASLLVGDGVGSGLQLDRGTRKISYAYDVRECPTSRKDGGTVVLRVIVELCMCIRIIYNGLKL